MSMYGSQTVMTGYHGKLIHPLGPEHVYLVQVPSKEQPTHTTHEEASPDVFPCRYERMTQNSHLFNTTVNVA